MWLGGTGAGAVVRLRHDVDDAVSAVLGADGLVRELTYVLRDVGEAARGVPIVLSGTAAGDELAARPGSEGMPAGLAGMGFANTRDLWPPCCAVVDGGAVVSVAFAARLSPLGAEVGVATAPQARGRGLAAAATAAWSAHPALAGRACGDTAAAENTSSLRVAERLGLRLLGPTVSVR
jgi:GNAT acetyltransferase